MRAVVADQVPTDFTDKHQHCLAAGMVARYCSLGEARLAAWGKEFNDALGTGDADLHDLEADYAGIDCARAARGDAALRQCCAALYPEPPLAPR